MPFELGLFLGAASMPVGERPKKTCLILDTEPFRYRRFISDIADHDVAAHKAEPDRAVKEVRDWLATVNKRRLPGADDIWQRFVDFQRNLPETCRAAKLNARNLIYADLRTVIEEWLHVTSPRAPIE